MINEIYVIFGIDPSKEYPVVIGSVYTENFNEEIDSFTIVLDNVTDRIVFGNPYHFVKIINKSNTGIKWNDKNYIFMLVDTYVETETNLDPDNKIYKYEIQLMNCVKLLEKIQCPNLVITHSLVNGSSTIYDYIDRYMKLYCPKVKLSTDGSTWTYQYLLSWNHLENDEKFQTVCADMQFNEPTLRQLITSLMMQVDCIPKLDYLTLNYIDFRETPTVFTKTGDMGFVSLSGASDSYVNTIVTSPTQILDFDNEIVSESLSFRNSDDAILKFEENFRLELKHPIYQIKKVTIQKFTNGGMYKRAGQSCLLNNDYLPVIWGNDAPSSSDYENIACPVFQNGRLNLKFCYLTYYWTSAILSDLKVHWCRYNSTTKVYTEDMIFQPDVSWTLTVPNHVDNKTYIQQLNVDGTLGTAVENGTTIAYQGRSYVFYISAAQPGGDLNNLYCWIEYKLKNTITNVETYCFLPMMKLQHSGDFYYLINFVQPNQENGYLSTYFSNQNVEITNLYLPTGGASFDITPLFVENSKRQLLSTDYVDMAQNATTIAELSQYIYGTLGYNIGDNIIDGFSHKYSFSEGWWSVTNTYWKNIINFISNNYGAVASDINSIPDFIKTSYAALNGNMPITSDTVQLASFLAYSGSTTELYFDYLFNIDYLPLSNIKMRLIKQNKDIDFNIEQKNSSESGLSEFDRFIKNNQSMTNRIGNEMFFATQMTTDLSNLQKINSIYNNKYTIFQRKIVINPDHLRVTYSGSENYVMQNYFTSIITKYRAYEYVNYNQSVLRKENTMLYCLISRNHNVTGVSDILKTFDNSLLLSGLVEHSIDYNNTLKYTVKSALNSDNNTERIKNELSVLEYDNGLILNYKDYDNVSSGPYIYSTASESNAGGWLQKWQQWDQSDYNTGHNINFISSMLIRDPTAYYDFPILNNDVIIPNTATVLSVQNNTTDGKFYFYKDNAEVINHTIQFLFYTDTDSVKWTRNLFKYTKLTGSLLNNLTAHKGFDIEDDWHTTLLNPQSLDMTVSGNTITINWSNMYVDSFVLSMRSGGKFLDLIAFKKVNDTDVYYLSVMDTPSTKVLRAETEGSGTGLFNKLNIKNGNGKYCEE